MPKRERAVRDLARRALWQRKGCSKTLEINQSIAVRRLKEDGST